MRACLKIKMWLDLGPGLLAARASFFYIPGNMKLYGERKNYRPRLLKVSKGLVI